MLKVPKLNMVKFPFFVLKHHLSYKRHRLNCVSATFEFPQNMNISILL